MLAIGGNAASTGYNLTRSLRFRASASASLSRTPASTTNRQIFTWSGWVKIGAIGSANAPLFQGYVSSTERTTFGYQSDILYFIDTKLGTSIVIGTSAVFRDPSAWYHIVLAIDTTQATAANRTKIYVNNILQTLSGSYVAQNTNTYIDANNLHYIGNDAGSAGRYYDGYLTEVNFIDGQALTPSSFGSTNALTGVWQPARYTGTYGTNGFYLPFTDNSALTTSSNAGLGKDFSGNGNYWTTNNISITAGVTYDSMTDVCTLTSATASNFCVWSPINKSTNHTVTDGNLTAASSGATSYGSLCATIGVASGKWYWEMTYTRNGTSNSPVIGFGNELFTYTNPPSGYLGSDLNAGGINVINGNAALNGTSTAYGSAIATNDVVMFAMDITNHKFYIGKNGTWFNSGDPAAGTNSWPYSATIVGSTFFPAVNMFNDTGKTTFGQRPFTYTPPTNFVALNTFNLPNSTIVKGNTVMDATLYTGNASTNTIVNAGAFKPDLVWPKSRSAVYNNTIYDSVRGATKTLFPNLTNAELTEATTLTSFNTNGFTLGSEARSNNNGTTFVAWQWQAGQGTTSSNTSGTITSTVSVNASAGFSVVTYTGTGAAATVGHGLGVAPQWIIVKVRNTAGFNWGVWHASLAGTTPFITLNTTNSASTNSVNAFISANMTSSVIGFGNEDTTNGAYNYVAYCWTPIAGYSAFGSYTGNGSTDGPFVYTGFRPKFVMVKCSSSNLSGGAHWAIEDSSRSTYNAADAILYANLTNAEGSGEPVDFLSNGFKIRNTVARWNSSGATFIYMAYAENPFKNSLAR